MSCRWTGGERGRWSAAAGCLPRGELLAPLGVHRDQAVDGLAVGDHLEDELVLLLVRLGGLEHLDDERRRDDDRAVVVGDDDVSRLDGGASAGDGHVRLPRLVQAAEYGRVFARGVVMDDGLV